MKRLGGLILAALLALTAPAAATELLNLSPITSAITATETGTFQLRAGPGATLPTNLGLQANFTYGSGGTSVDAYVQTSLDGGTTWIDAAEFHFATTSERYAYNLNSSTSVTAEYTATDGSLSSNTAKDGIFGPLWRVKYTSTGTYAGGTSLRIDGFANGLTAFTPGD